MKIETNEHGTIVLSEVFNPIKLVTEKGETLIVTMRDSGFELCYQNDFYEAKGGELKPYGRAESPEQAAKWTRYRFVTTSTEDYRPVKFDKRFPFWCSGQGPGYVTVVAYLHSGEDLLAYWPEATHVQSEPRGSIQFTDRFPKPDYFVES